MSLKQFSKNISKKFGTYKNPSYICQVIKNKHTMEKLKALFVEVVKANLSKYETVSVNMVANTIQHFAQMTPFNTISIEQWYCICNNNGVKYDA